jgi:hypothetical protein
MPDRLDENGFVRLDNAAQDIARCGLCNADGYRGSTVCDHVDHSAAAKRGIQLIREALARKDQP